MKDPLEQALGWLQEQTDRQPEIGLVLGSCAGTLSALLEQPQCIPYANIPGFLQTTVDDHAGQLLFGTVAGRQIVCLSGRFHHYEGYEFEQLSLPMRLFCRLGLRVAILTNAAGAIHSAYRPGDVMVLRDQIKLMGQSPLRGKNEPSYGPRFVDAGNLFDPALRRLALDCALGTGLRVHEGNYFYFSGPQFETPAEIRAARLLGADAVGMSTVTESISAAHCGIPLLALSLLVNPAAGIVPEEPVDAGIGAVSAALQQPLRRYIQKIIERI